MVCTDACIIYHRHEDTDPSVLPVIRPAMKPNWDGVDGTGTEHEQVRSRPGTDQRRAGTEQGDCKKPCASLCSVSTCVRLHPLASICLCLHLAASASASSSASFTPRILGVLPLFLGYLPLFGTNGRFVGFLFILILFIVIITISTEARTAPRMRQAVWFQVSSSS